MPWVSFLQFRVCARLGSGSLRGVCSEWRRSGAGAAPESVLGKRWASGSQATLQWRRFRASKCVEPLSACVQCLPTLALFPRLSCLAHSSRAHTRPMSAARLPCASTEATGTSHVLCVCRPRRDGIPCGPAFADTGPRLKRASHPGGMEWPKAISGCASSHVSALEPTAVELNALVWTYGRKPGHSHGCTPPPALAPPSWSAARCRTRAAIAMETLCDSCSVRFACRSAKRCTTFYATRDKRTACHTHSLRSLKRGNRYACEL